jgi:hypothetical protein
MKQAAARLAFGVAIGMGAGALQAADLNQLQNLGTQQNFRLLTEDLGAALSYKSISPATPLGITGFDIGVDASMTKLDSNAFGLASGSGRTVLPMARLRVQKGLPLDFDIGASYAQVPGTRIKLWGGELRYAILAGSLATPAVAVRGSFTTLSGVDQLDFSTKAIDLSISKGFLGVTPYGGVGRVWATGDPHNVAGLTSQTVGLNKLFAGVNFGLGIFAAGAEIDRTGSSNTISAKIALRW